MKNCKWNWNLIISLNLELTKVLANTLIAIYLKLREPNLVFLRVLIHGSYTIAYMFCFRPLGFGLNC